MNPMDLVQEKDVLALDIDATALFGVKNLSIDAKRRVAVTDWLGPKLEAHGFKPNQHQTRHAPRLCVALTGGTYTDLAPTLTNQTPDDLDLADVFVTPSTDALFVGMPSPRFEGVYVAMGDSVNVTPCAATVMTWEGRWVTPPPAADGTEIVSGRAFSGSGRIRWGSRDGMLPRYINNSPGYWCRIQVNSPPATHTRIGQVLPLIHSRLTYPAALYTLGLLYREGHGTTRGAWLEKANAFFSAAEDAFTLAVGHVADEFDADDSGATDPVEINSVRASLDIARVTRWERG